MSETHTDTKTLDERKLALDERRLDFEIAQHRDQMELERESRQADRAEKRWAQWSSPLVLAIIGGIVALIGNGFVAWDNGRQASSKAANDLEVEKVKDDATLVIEAIKTGDTLSAQENLRLLARARLLNDSNKQASILEALKDGIQPGLPAPAAQSAPTAGPCASATPVPSGPEWAICFPASNSLDDLVPDFRDNTRQFVQALVNAGAHVFVAITRRPPERAYLQHWSVMVAQSTVKPEDVPPMPGVNIIWAHTDADGNINQAESVAAAQQLTKAFAIQFPAALVSRHTQARAVDMTISWSDRLSIKRKDGSSAVIDDGPRNGSNPDLVQVGKTYGVIKLVSDPPHWSDDGH